MDSARLPEAPGPALKPRGGYPSPRLNVEMLRSQLAMAKDEDDELRSVERLTDELAIAGTEIFSLRAELAAALEQAEAWRTKYEHAVSWASHDRRGVVAERRQTSPNDLVEIKGDWHKRSGTGRRWPQEVPGWLAKAGAPAPHVRHKTAKARLFHSRRRGGVVILAILAVLAVAAVVVGLVLAPGVTGVVLLGLALGAVSVLVAEKLGTRSGHAVGMP